MSMARASLVDALPRRRSSSTTVGLLSALTLVCGGCPGSTTRGPDAAAQASPKSSESLNIAESIYEGGLSDGWHESGSSTRDLAVAGPARIRFGSSGEWVLTRSQGDGHYGGILFRVKEPSGEGEFLEVRLGSADGRAFRGVKLKPDHRTEIGDGWTQVLVPMSELNPDGAPFDRVVFRPFRPVGEDWVSLDKIALAKGSP